MPEAFWNFRELPSLVLNDVFHDEAMRAIDGRRVSFVYQRYSLNNYAGLRLAQRLGVPAGPRIQRFGDLDEPPLGTAPEVRAAVFED